MKRDRQHATEFRIRDYLVIIVFLFHSNMECNAWTSRTLHKCGLHSHKTITDGHAAFRNTSANSGSSKNRRLNGSSTKGDASVPTPLHTAPAPTRPGTLIPDFGLKRSFERKLNSLHFLQHLSNITVILI